MLPAILHTNGTARVQTVSPSHNPFLAEVLSAFEKLTGHPVLINTSLNVKGQADLRYARHGAGLLGRIRSRRAAAGRVVGDKVRIGYSFCGFLGPGVVDTPDAGAATDEP